MSLSKYKSTNESTNYARMDKIILDPCTKILRKVLMKEITPANLIKKVNNYIAKNKKPPINQPNQQLIYNCRDYSEFDITLLYFLFRNISSISPHTMQWGNNPDPSDRSISANIERIRLKRNYHVHIKHPSISNLDFEQEWKQIFQIVKELEHYLGSSTDLQDNVRFMRSCSMDPYVEQINIQQQNATESLGDEVYNQKESNKIEISKWKEDEIVFLETHNFPVMLEQVRKQPFVTFVGVPGSGKTVTARHIALILQTEGYEIIPIRDIRNVETCRNPRRPQVFVIDDVVGVFGLNVGEIDVIGKYKDLLENPLHAETKTLMTCREVIYRNERSLNSFLFKKERVILLHSDENALNDKDKLDLFKKYNIDNIIISPDDLPSVSKMFPYLCKLYSKEEEFKDRYGKTFFKCPFYCISKELDEMQLKNKIQYASLVLLTAAGSIRLDEKRENIYSKNLQFDEMKCNILKKCKLNHTTECFEIIDALSEMEETYTKRRENEFTLIQNTMFEIIAHHFGCKFPELILKYLNAEYIAHYVKVEMCNMKEKNNKSKDVINDKTHEDSKLRETNAEHEIEDLFIILEESYYEMFAERLLRDIKNGDLHVVFKNEALKNQFVLKHFVEFLTKKSYPELQSLFFSDLKEKSKISKIELACPCVHDGSHFYMHKLLYNERTTHTSYRNCIRAISWVIYHGHHKILQILIETISKKGHLNDLFQNSYNKNHRRFSVSVGDTNKSFAYDNAKHFNRNSEISRCTMTVDDTKSELVAKEQCRLLCLGCHSGDLNTVQILLKYVQKDAINDTLASLYCNKENVHWNIKPLIIACKLGYEDIVVTLIKAGANVNLKDSFHTPLTAACENGHVVVVKELIKVRADVNKKHKHITPLSVASYMGHVNAVKELIKAGADVNLTVEGKTPLTTACSNGCLSVVKELIKAGADVNQRDEFKTPLNIACFSGQLDIIKELIKAGANVNLNDLCHIKLTTPYGKGHLSLVEKLIKAGANINVNSRSYTPQRAACYRGDLNLLRVLLKAGADVNLTVEGKTPLTTACSNGCLSVVKELIQAGADVNQRDKYRTPLNIACYNGQLDIVKELIKAGANVNLNDLSHTPLTASCDNGHLSVVEELIKAGANINVNYRYNTPLRAACYRGHLSVVRMLLKAGAVVNQRERDKTPLITACLKGHLSIVQELKKAGANVN